jgi:hypothetical protein
MVKPLAFMGYHPMMDKTCIVCNETFDREVGFYKSGKGVTSRCRRCHNIYARERYLLLTPEQRTERSRTRQARKYGLTRDQYEAMGAEQNYACYLCGRQTGAISRGRGSWDSGLTLDHDHVTGTLRRLLCSNCNMAVGHAQDDPALLRRMADYVESYRQGA